jgi:hypothetical protein
LPLSEPDETRGVQVEPLVKQVIRPKPAPRKRKDRVIQIEVQPSVSEPVADSDEEESSYVVIETYERTPPTILDPEEPPEIDPDVPGIEADLLGTISSEEGDVVPDNPEEHSSSEGNISEDDVIPHSPVPLVPDIPKEVEEIGNHHSG